MGIYHFQIHVNKNTNIWIVHGSVWVKFGFFFFSFFYKQEERNRDSTRQKSNHYSHRIRSVLVGHSGWVNLSNPMDSPNLNFKIDKIFPQEPIYLDSRQTRSALWKLRHSSVCGLSEKLEFMENL